MKRMSTTQYSNSGEALKEPDQPESQNLSTPEEIKSRKIFRAKRKSTPMAKTGFILQSKLLPENLEEQLLKDTKSASVDFLSIPDEEVKELSPEKSKTKVSENFISVKPQPVQQVPEKKSLPISDTKSPFNKELSNPSLKYSNPFDQILKKINDQKEEEVISGFISSNAPKVAEAFAPISFLGVPAQKSVFEVLISVEGQLSVDSQDRGTGFIEIAKGNISEKRIASFIFKNKIKNVVYQAGITSLSQMKECEDRHMGEDDAQSIEVELNVYRNHNGKIVRENSRILIETKQKENLAKQLQIAKDFLASRN